ncbi:MAG: hypothetical protein V4696_00805 [Pseudomonadota bacterium]
MTNHDSKAIEREIERLLGDDPVCMGRVCSGTVEAIAALAKPSTTPDVAENVIDLEKTGFQLLVEAVAQSNWIPPEYMANDWLSDCCHFLRTGEGIQANALASLSAQLAVKDEALRAARQRWELYSGGELGMGQTDIALMAQIDAALGDK